MNIRPVGAELLDVGGQAGGRVDRETNTHDEANMGRLISFLGRHTEHPKWLEVADHLVQSDLW
jgi:hypothetical protein